MIGDPIFEIIPRSTANTLQPAPYGVLQNRLRRIFSGSTARMSGQAAYEEVYRGYEKPSFNAFEKLVEATNATLEAEGSTWRVGSTLWFGKCAPEDVRRKPRKKSGNSSFEPSE